MSGEYLPPDGEHSSPRFAADEVRVLREVASEVVGLLTDGFDHQDPVVGRLFPDVYRRTRRSSAEFRRYTEEDLKAGKIDQAGAVLAACRRTPAARCGSTGRPPRRGCGR